jgi:hypothetical protein
MNAFFEGDRQERLNTDWQMINGAVTRFGMTAPLFVIAFSVALAALYFPFSGNGGGVKPFQTPLMM